jgi:hypothetical protein
VLRALEHDVGRRRSSGPAVYGPGATACGGGRGESWRGRRRERAGPRAPGDLSRGRRSRGGAGGDGPPSARAGSRRRATGDGRQLQPVLVVGAEAALGRARRSARAPRRASLRCAIGSRVPVEDRQAHAVARLHGSSSTAHDPRPRRGAEVGRGHSRAYASRHAAPRKSSRPSSKRSALDAPQQRELARDLEVRCAPPPARRTSGGARSTTP